MDDSFSSLQITVFYERLYSDFILVLWGSLGGGFETIKTKNPIAKFTVTFDLKLHGKHRTEDNLVA